MVTQSRMRGPPVFQAWRWAGRRQPGEYRKKGEMPSPCGPEHQPGCPSLLPTQSCPYNTHPESTRSGLLCDTVQVEKYSMMERHEKGSRLTVHRFPWGAQLASDTAAHEAVPVGQTRRHETWRRKEPAPSTQKAECSPLRTRPT